MIRNIGTDSLHINSGAQIRDPRRSCWDPRWWSISYLSRQFIMHDSRPSLEFRVWTPTTILHCDSWQSALFFYFRPIFRCLSNVICFFSIFSFSSPASLHSIQDETTFYVSCSWWDNVIFPFHFLWQSRSAQSVPQCVLCIQRIIIFLVEEAGWAAMMASFRSTTKICSEEKTKMEFCRFY